MIDDLRELNEEDELTYEASDESLEVAAGNIIAGNYTLGSCTGLSVCPASPFARGKISQELACVLR
jgi:hypothetical protein